ncbi:MAG: pilus assembly protein PilQ, partial [Neisseriaceae bacterium]|nr:pilus assembly protein PilQ [Neisseriaceae bacterium]
MQEEGNAKIISSPRVLTLNGEEALLEDGMEVAYRIMQGDNEGFTTEFKRAVTSLKVTPQITPDGNVMLNVEVSKDTPFQENGAISVKKLNTRAMIEDGGTLILGGIYDESSSDGVNKVPFLGDLPVVGNAFKTKNRNSERREVLIFLTPKVVKASEGSLSY